MGECPAFKKTISTSLEASSAIDMAQTAFNAVTSIRSTTNALLDQSRTVYRRAACICNSRGVMCVYVFVCVCGVFIHPPIYPPYLFLQDKIDNGRLNTLIQQLEEAVKLAEKNDLNRDCVLWPFFKIHVHTHAYTSSAQTDTQTHRHTDTQTHRHTDTHTHTHTHTPHTNKHTHTRTHTHTDKHKL